MTTKTYTNTSNCARAAKVALGKDAKNGVDFVIEGEKGKHVWRAVGKKTEPAKPTAKPGIVAKTAAKLKSSTNLTTPAPRTGSKKEELVKLLTKGATIDAMCDALDWQAHTIRGQISTLGSALPKGQTIERTKKDGVSSYKIVTKAA